MTTMTTEREQERLVTIERSSLEGLTTPEGFKSWDDWIDLYNNTDVESKWRLLKLASECKEVE